MIEQQFLQSTTRLFRQYKKLGEDAIHQLADEELFASPNKFSNSIAHIVHHLSGNMLSRWTDFLTTDGEKAWRKREAEFDEVYSDKAAMMKAWEEGWNCLFDAVESLKPDDLLNVIYIRNEEHSVLEAIHRQLAHYPHHVGQIVYQAKAIKSSDFQSLSIPRGKSETFNDEKFGQPRERKHQQWRPDLEI